MIGNSLVSASRIQRSVLVAMAGQLDRGEADRGHAIRRHVEKEASPQDIELLQIT